jgi:nucleotide-binding universal stress UspA family protein
MEMNESMARIVVGVDGSAGAEKALHWACAEARLRGATLHVVHAWTVPLIEAIPDASMLGVPRPGPSDEEVYEHLRRAAEDVLDSCVRRGLADEDCAEVTLTQELLEGRPSRVLLESAGDADLLVVGSRGLGGFQGLLLGSVCAQCVHHAPCPVVIVP